MDRLDFRDSFINEIKSYSISNMCSDREAFFEYGCSLIAEAGEILDYNACFFEGRVENKTNVVLDGYYFDKFTKELNLIILDFDPEFKEHKIGIPQIRRLIQGAMSFIDNRELLLNHLDESTLAFQFADWLKYMWDVIKKIRVVILSTEKASTRRKTIKFDHDGRDVYYNLWGVERFRELINRPANSGSIEINLMEYTDNGIPALYASDTKVKDYESYLAVVPGSLLADLYDDYGAKLLEGNVRSFLSYRGNVNKAIRATLIGTPHMFFAFNNGIAATAGDIESHIVNGELYIKSFVDFQIVNGGQTTASIFNVKHVRKEADLLGVYVPMKLNVVKDKKKAEKLIPIIAETANTQNKVNKADFFANSGFHRRIEQLSLLLTSPTLAGQQFGTKWFYERARGSYEAKLISFKTSNAKREHFKATHPKNQRITKTDLAKYYNSFSLKPFHVSKGAQRNFIEFASQMDKIWRTSESKINDEFFKKIVVTRIIFKCLEKIISNADWYQNAFRANIVTYSISYLFYYIKEVAGKTLNTDIIWQYQSVSNEFEEMLSSIAFNVFVEITREETHRTRNVTEWAKKEECWKELVQNVNLDLSPYLDDYLISQVETEEKNKKASKKIREVERINNQIQVVELGDSFWKKVLDYGERNKTLTSKDHSLIKIASQMTSTGRIPSESQSKLILGILENIKMEGFVLDEY